MSDEVEKEKEHEPAVTISKSLWMQIIRSGLRQKFYDSDAITRLFMGDSLDDILSHL